MLRRLLDKGRRGGLNDCLGMLGLACAQGMGPVPCLSVVNFEWL